MSQFLNTYIHITGITDTSFTLGDPTPDSNGIDILKDGNTYSYITNNGATFEVGTGKFTSATRSLSRNITESSSIDNQPIGWPTGTVLRLTVPPISGDTGSSGGGGSGSDITVIDDLGSSRTDAISQRAATDAIKQRVASIDSNLGIASMQLDGEGNIIVTDKQGGQHNVSLSAVSGDGAKDGDALAKTLNLYIGKDGSILLLDSSGKLWSIPDVSSMTKAIADAGSGSTNTTYATTDLANVTDATFQARKLSVDQIVSALGFEPLGSADDLAIYAKKDFSNVNSSTIQAMKLVSKQIIDALGYEPAAKIDANGLALTDLSNVSNATVTSKVTGFVSNSSTDDLSALGVYRKWTTSSLISGGNNDGTFVGFFLKGQKDSTGATGVYQIPTKDQVSAMISSGGGSNITLVDNLNGNSTTAAPTQNAVVNGLKRCITGMNGTAFSVQNIYAHNTGSGTTVGANENITVQFTNYGGNKVSVELGTQPWITANFQPKGTYLTASNIVQSVGTSTTNTLSQNAIATNYAPKAIDNISGTSTTAPPSQNSVKVAVADLQSKIDALTARVTALESK